MGRSKFPGKPSKHGNRTRINVLSTTVNTVVGDDTTVVTEDNSKKVDSTETSSPDTNESEQPTTLHTPPRTERKKRVKITKKRTSILVSTSTKSPLKTVARLTRGNVVTRKSVRGYTSIRKLAKSKLSPKKEATNLVGKFVLPSRSVHSSRVIKPNKRFINIEQNETRIVKKRVINKRLIKVETPKFSEFVEESAENHVDNNAPTNGKVVLRQARLQIHSNTPVGPEGPFSINTGVVLKSPGTVTCGVCGAVRFYRFVKQARKFNIYCCESCRKFISKLIQRSNNKNITSPLNCHKGQGMCHVPPIVRSQQWKFNRIAYNSRCPACWLKMCLRSFQMPMALKASLSQLLPKHMQPNDSFTTSLPLLTWQSNTSDVPIDNKTDNKDINLRQRPVRNKPIKKEKPTNLPVVNDIKRQKVDLKGPRVKHVCRSASIVLGHPIATFPEKKEEVLDKSSELEEASTSKTEIAANIVESDIKHVESIPGSQEIEVSATVKIKELPALAVPKKEKKIPISMLPIEITKPSISKKAKKMSQQVEGRRVIDIDYWENYDPDDVVCNGFCIIASEKFPMHSICFLCGSTGKETLLYCCICCEPYHPYCLEQEPPNLSADQKYTWICPKCTTCSACGESDRQKINCQKCHKAYHPQCFNTKWRTDDRPTVCSNCLRCKSCGTDNITKFVGNLALCLLCFKLRNRGNFCPVCQCCYDDNDFDTKMMECGKCNKWIHAKCEGLSDEQYQILSILPESVEFFCCLCSSQVTPHWRKAVQSELRSCFNNILRLLSKNRIARDMLKLSPVKPCSPVVNNLNTARRLQFVDEVTSNEEYSIDSDLEQVNAIFKNKIEFGDSFNSSMPSDSKVPISPSMIEIKNKINCNEYFSLRDFNEGMERALNSTSSDELLKIYRSILKKVFPWFDPLLKDDLNKTICDTSRVQQSEEDKKYEQFEVHNTKIKDNRMCNLCKGIGDGLADKEARLLYCGHNEWVHANCALWSSEVYEEIDGSLQNVLGAINRGRSMKCAFCKQKGASVGCCLKGCYETYHFPCAQKAECQFIVDKTIYCKTHELSDKLSVITNDREFEIKRSVYIEIDNKRKRFCEPDGVSYMVGSLSVINLGKIFSSVSDNIEALIPVGFVCSRLFWSTTEPWKLIPYKITTSILNTHSHVYVDKNFTVDHTLPKHFVDKKLREISLWQRDDKDKTLLEDFEEYGEPQNAGDLLSPELTDAILEELPHDLLDGISVQEMLMGYEELMNMDFKTSEINCNDNLSMNMNGESKLDDCDENKGKELKRSKSEVFQKIEDKIKPKNQQRSCSLTWLQLDNTLSPAIKKRKRESNMFMQLLQVDGACDSSGSECESPTHENEDVWSDTSEDPVTCEKCQCTYRTNASYKRHLESCDAMFMSESEPETEILANNLLDNSDQQIVTSYETFSSYQTTQNEVQSMNVMNTQTILTESKVQENNGLYYNYQPIKSIVPPQSNVININQPISISQSTDSSSPIFCINQQNMNITLNHPNVITMDKNTISINHPPIMSVDNTQVLNPISTMMDMQQQPVAIQTVPFTTEVSPLINIAQPNQTVAIDTKLFAPNLVNIPQNQWMRPILPQNKARPKPRLVAKRPRVQNNTIVLPQSTTPSVILQHIPTSNSMIPFVDAYHQTSGQNVQYVTTIAPQINSAITPQTQLVQLPENNFLSLVPSVQPTMIIQQPRMDTGQLIVDANGAMVWATQPVQQVQPVYYGFETIVQNTVMQSQQFLPTTVPGVLTTNRSYSATTQVFQTSKLEPVMDGSFVLVNQNQVVNQPTPVQVPQIQACITPNVTSNVQTQNKISTFQIEASQSQEQQPQIQSQSHTPQHHIQAQPSASLPNQIKNPPQNQQKQQPVQVQPQVKSVQVTTNTNSPATNSITLPVAPFVPEQGIPMNIVTPTLKPPTLMQCRPMSRVLPMQTTVPQKKSEKVITKEISNSIEKIPVKMDKQKITLLTNTIIKPSIPLPPTERVDTNTTKVLKDIKEVVKPEVKETKTEKDISGILKTNKQVVSLKPIKTKIIHTITSDNNKENTSDSTESNVEEPIKSKVHRQRSNPQNISIYYKIESEDGVDYTSTSLPQMWRKIFNEVQSARLANNLPPLPEIALKTINDLDLLGLRTKGMKYLLEQLPDASKCKTYKPVFHKPNDTFKFEDNDEEEETAHRCMPYSSKQEKYDMFGWLSSQHRLLEMYDLDSILKKNVNSQPTATRFKNLKVISKYSVGVYRSEIHGRGLFSLRDIESGEMVIEYAGEVIRSVLTDKREKQYNAKGIGCYMFRIDDNLVVDATMRGNAARFINHSCDPNCYSKVVEISGCKHIIIFALRKIICGEELTYDYKFPFEEDKIPCTCGTKRCRKFLN